MLSKLSAAVHSTGLKFSYNMLPMIYRFYRNDQGWFIDLPNYPFSQAHLSMVKGADVLLGQLAGDNTEIRIEGSTRPIAEHTDVLDRVQLLGLGKGAIYRGNKVP